jgi:hypothetical protein
MARNAPKTAATNTGVSPDARACPRCGRRVGGFFAMTRFQPARHLDPKTKRPCREPKREAETGRVLGEPATTVRADPKTPLGGRAC